jgi:heptaprenyl diphosphate synthase
VTFLKDPVSRARDLIHDDVVRFQATLEETLKPQADYLTETEYETYRRGKKLRPIMLMLAARMVLPDGVAELPEKVIKAAVSLEMLHVATLIHDDIVDVAPVRRGLRTVYSERGTEMAVLLGDMQFIQAIRCFVDGIDTQEDMYLIKMVLDTGFDICRGELDEIMTDPHSDPVLLRQRYYRTIDRKTATLFALACESGCMLAGGTKRQAFYLSRYGRRFGTAFQIMDDIFDVVRPEHLAGKSPGIDIEQGRLSLPILYALEDFEEGHVLRRILRKEPHTAEDLAMAVESVGVSAGTMKAYSKAREYALEAVDFLSEFPASVYRTALEEIATHAVDRDFMEPD